MSEVQPLWVHDPVAANVRAELARKGISVNRLSDLVGQNQSYWARRMGGRTEFSASDLVALAGLLNVHPGVFFNGAGIENGPAVEVPGRSVRRQGLEPRTRYIRASASEDGVARILEGDEAGEVAGSEEFAAVLTLPTWRNRPGIVKAVQ